MANAQHEGGVVVAEERLVHRILGIGGTEKFEDHSAQRERRASGGESAQRDAALSQRYGEARADGALQWPAGEPDLVDT